MKYLPAYLDYLTKDSSYKIPDSTKSQSGIYNLWIVFVILLILLSYTKVLPSALVIFYVTLFSIALFIDRTRWTTKLSLRVLPLQLKSYLLLFVQFEADMFRLLLPVTLVFYVLFRPLLHDLHVWGGNSFWPLFWTQTVIQSILLLLYLSFVLFYWTNEHPALSLGPFDASSRRANFSSKSSTIRHLIWSFCLAQVGRMIPASIQVSSLYMLDLTYDAVHFDSIYPSDIKVQVLFALMGLIFFRRSAETRWLLAEFYYYKIHRTMHENRILYNASHRIHHRCLYCSPLDSGTEGPSDYFLSNQIFLPSTVTPDWYFCLKSIQYTWGPLWGHFAWHFKKNRYDFHVDHHRFVDVNYGLDTLIYDRKFQSTGEDLAAVRKFGFIDHPKLIEEAT